MDTKVIVDEKTGKKTVLPNHVADTPVIEPNLINYDLFTAEEELKHYMELYSEGIKQYINTVANTKLYKRLQMIGNLTPAETNLVMQKLADCDLQAKAHKVNLPFLEEKIKSLKSSIVQK